MNTEDSLRAEESGSPHLQDGCEEKEGSRPSFLSGNVTDYMHNLSSISMDVSCRGENHFLFLESHQHGAFHSSKSEANVHLKPSTWVPKF